jgi:type IV pilus assembly protein PilC
MNPHITAALTKGAARPMKFASAEFAGKIALEDLSFLCGNLATCIRAGLDIPTCLRTCQRSLPSLVLRDTLVIAAERAADGDELFSALKPLESRLPIFFLPVLRCGEESGRLEETLRYLEQHCRLLAETARVMRNTWFVPLCLIAAGTVFSAIAYLLLAPMATAMQYILSSLIFYGVTAAAVWMAFRVPQLRLIVDQLKLAIPVIGPAQRELTINRFFHALNLLYSAGGRRVETMIHLAADSADNTALLGDFLRAADIVAAGGTIGEAFTSLALLPQSYAITIVTGDEAGKLEAAFEMVCRQSAESVKFSVALFQKFFFRVVSAAVILSLTGTLWMLVAMKR